ncbi:MFS transporter [Bradyrhizobium jicamae]|uniref:MFS transporter n=1 Tax=Bradyrhizobium jicamae TaxID=280332 RepID=A0ABS5FIH6_9BRAD|nr:MFS transporter [Bradyrhizobium jicamae]MBR0796556.1 MFS transporter [Bradyrhizobium jicamae]MBR0935045.1 MFS transporter [Bradyrhizobium jicamae]
MNQTAITETSRTERAPAARTLAVAGLNHALHDGYTDLIYVLLPVWQAEFALSYGLLALLRGLYAGAMAGLQIPVGRIAERVDGKLILMLGTALSALGYLLAGLSGGILGLASALALSGAGSSTQHPIASAAVSRAYGKAARGPLGIYNFSGDLGKAAIPALTSILLVIMSWRHTLLLLAFAGVLVAGCVALWMPSLGKGRASKSTAASPHAGARAGGFHWLLAIGILDTAVRMGFLTFLPFLLRDKGASLPTSGFALALVFIGGAAGKFTCGWLGERVGTLRTVLLTEGGTAALILAVLVLPLTPAVVLLPLLGVMLNGTSSVLYGTVPELTPPHQTERAFALFYTGTIGSGAIAPVLYGLLGDALGPSLATAATAATALAICPLAIALARHLAEDPTTA